MSLIHDTNYEFYLNNNIGETNITNIFKGGANDTKIQLRFYLILINTYLVFWLNNYCIKYL
jgi:hypothetical protein